MQVNTRLLACCSFGDTKNIRPIKMPVPLIPIDSLRDRLRKETSGASG